MILDDLQTVGCLSPEPISESALIYCNQIEKIGKFTPELLISHFYTRYFADLFGGSMLGKPTQLAMNLIKTPRYYEFPDEVNINKKQFIESLYQDINEYGTSLDSNTLDAIVNETVLAFKLNEAIYEDFPKPLVFGAFKGVVNVVKGSLKNYK